MMWGKINKRGPVFVSLVGVGKEGEREREREERERDELENFLGFRGYVPPVVPNNLSIGVPNFVLPCYFENFSLMLRHVFLMLFS